MTLRRIATALIALLFAVALPMTSSYASHGGGGGGSHGGGHSGGGHSGGGSHNGHHGHGGHGHFTGGFVAGVGFGSLWWPWTYPIAPAVYDVPMWLPSYDIDPVYTPQLPAPAPPEYWWYYCADTQAYYPYVQQCASPWQRVAPTPPQ